MCKVNDNCESHSAKTASPSQMSEFCEHCGLTFLSRDDLNLHVPVCREKLWVHDVSLHAPDDFDFLDESEASASRLSEQ